MSALVLETANYSQISATTVVRSGPTRLLGIILSSGTSPTVLIRDNTATGSGTIAVNTMPLITGFNPIPVTLNTGLGVELGGTGVQATVLYDPA